MSADLTTNEIVIFDRRFSSDTPLFKMSHSYPQRIVQNNDAYVATAWISPELLLTGGEDSYVRLWHLASSNTDPFERTAPDHRPRLDLQAPSPQLIQEWELDHPINAICLSEDHSTFAAGTEIGGLHLFSIDASLIASGDAFAFQFAQSL